MKATGFERQLELDDPRSFGPGVSSFRCFPRSYVVVWLTISAVSLGSCWSGLLSWVEPFPARISALGRTPPTDIER